MRLDAWLAEQPPLAERLRVVERLAQAVDESNRMQKPLGVLEPARVEVSDEQDCDVSAARRGTAGAPYAAPERLDGAPPSAESDIYSAGAIAWEVLAGRPCGDPPEHLSTAAREVARELADAVMACLERSPEWRPKDLSYVAELARTGQEAAARSAPRGSAKRQAAPRPAAPARAAPSPRPATRERRAPKPPGSRGLYLALAAVLLAGAAALAFYTLGPFGRGVQKAPTPSAEPVRPDTLAATPVAPTQAPATATPVATPAPAVATARATAAAPTTLAAAAPTPQPTRPALGAPPTGTAPSAPLTAAPLAPVTPTTTAPAAPPRAAVVQQPPPQTPTTTAPAAQAAAQQTAPATAPPAATTSAAPTAAAPPAAALRGPATLTALSPLSAKRPGKVLFDLHGTGLHDELRAAIVPVKEAPRGITIVRQKCQSDTLMKVLVDIDAAAAPGAYAIVLDDAAGRQTKPLTFTVVR